MAKMLPAGLAWLATKLDAAGAQAIETCSIIIEEYAPDAYGEQVATEVLEAVDVPCQVRPLSAESLVKQGRDASMRMVQIDFLGPTPPFPEDDGRQRLIRIGSRTYRPMGTLNLGSADTQWRVDCVAVVG